MHFLTYLSVFVPYLYLCGTKGSLYIDLYVINVGGYIGQSTRSEIEYAKQNGKSVNYLEAE